MSEELIQRTATVAESEAVRFDAMAARIRRNSGEGFGGAFVIAPPQNGGTAIETLLVDVRQDPVQFWTLLRSKCEAELDELREREKNQSAFGRR